MKPINLVTDYSLCEKAFRKWKIVFIYSITYYYSKNTPVNLPAPGHKT